MVTTQGDLPFVVHEPDPATSTQLQSLTDSLQAVDNDVVSMVDHASFINWYLVQELARNNDAASFSSIWLTKATSSALKIGPLWDFDIAFGNIDYNGCDDPEGWHIQKYFAWYKTLMADPTFAAKVRTRWNELKGPMIDTLPDLIDNLAAGLSLAQKNNHSRWLILDKKVWPNRVVTGSYEGEVAELKFWLLRRIAWMDAQLNP